MTVPISQIYARAVELETLLRSVSYVLDAIHHGGLFDALPDGKEHAARHNTGSGLILHISDEVNRVLNADGPDLSDLIDGLRKEAA